MVLLFFAFDEYVVNVHFHVPPNLFVEHLVYQSLVHGPYVLQTKRHDPVVVEPLAEDEGRHFLIFLYHLYLVVLREGVHKGKELVLGCRIHKLVDSGLREAVL